MTCPKIVNKKTKIGKGGYLLLELKLVCKDIRYGNTCGLIRWARFEKLPVLVTVI